MAFLSEPRFEGLPFVMETPGPDSERHDRRGGRATRSSCASAGWRREGSDTPRTIALGSPPICTSRGVPVGGAEMTLPSVTTRRT